MIQYPFHNVFGLVLKGWLFWEFLILFTLFVREDSENSVGLFVDIRFDTFKPTFASDSTNTGLCDAHDGLLERILKSEAPVCWSDTVCFCFAIYLLCNLNFGLIILPNCSETRSLSSEQCWDQLIPCYKPLFLKKPEWIPVCCYHDCSQPLLPAVLLQLLNQLWPQAL